MREVRMVWRRKPRVVAASLARRMVAGLTTVAFTFATLLLPSLQGAAWAQAPEAKAPDGRVRVFLLPLHHAADSSRITATRLDELLRASLGLSDSVHLLGDTDLIIAVAPDPNAAPPANARLEEADAQVWKGKELLEKKNAQAAVELQKAVELYRDNYADLVDYDKLVDAYVQLAEALFRGGYDDNGSEALASAMSLRPTLTVDKRLQHKSFVAAFDKLEAEFDNQKAGSFAVSSSPPGAKVFIDGILRGNTPLTATDLRKGTHYLQLRLDGYKVDARTFRAPMGEQREQIAVLLDVDTKQSGDVAGEYISPEALMPYAESGNFNENFRRAARTFADGASVDAVLYGIVSRAPEGFALHLYAYNRKAGEIAALNPVTFDPELANAQIRLLDVPPLVVSSAAAFPTHRIVLDPPPAPYRLAASAVPVAVAAPVLPDKPPAALGVLGDYPSIDDLPPGVTEVRIDSEDEGDGTEWYKSWWFWTLVGVGVAGAGVGTAAGLGAFESKSSSNSGGFGGAIQLP